MLHPCGNNNNSIEKRGTLLLLTKVISSMGLELTLPKSSEI
jgi:hypothetical protein